MEHWSEYTRFLTALIVILDPFAAIPLFLAFTHGYHAKERRRVAHTTALTVVAVLLIAALLGESMLRWMGTSLASFRVGGGVVLLLMALALLGTRSDAMTTPDAQPPSDARDKFSVGVVPLAIPLLAGPGAIGTVIIQMHRSTAPYHGMVVITCILLSCLLLWGVLRLAEPIGAWLGSIGLSIVNRLFGLILTAIAIEIMANGLKQLFPVLAR